MVFKYTLPDGLVAKVLRMHEFANGGTQVTMRLRDGRIYGGILVSAARHPIAIRGYTDLPFAVADIEDVFQTDDDRSPKLRSEWVFWDQWK